MKERPPIWDLTNGIHAFTRGHRLADGVEYPDGYISGWLQAERHAREDHFEHICVHAVRPGDRVRLVYSGRVKSATVQAIKHAPRSNYVTLRFKDLPQPSVRHGDTLVLRRRDSQELLKLGRGPQLT